MVSDLLVPCEYISGRLPGDGYQFMALHIPPLTPGLVLVRYNLVLTSLLARGSDVRLLLGSINDHYNPINGIGNVQGERE